ncbi:MAG: ThuA domain-containing protein [Fimbriimonadaceae bacterium]|nr:ThuA domain-containing protein [Fimbriimonadaceae bacterium]
MLSTLLCLHAVIAPSPVQASVPGATFRLYELPVTVRQMPELVPGQTPNVDQLISKVSFGDGEFFGRSEQFYVEITANLRVPTTGRYGFRLTSDDGSVLLIDDREVLNHDGVHAATTIETATDLSAGNRKLRLRYFEANGQESLRLEWRVPGGDWQIVDQSVLSVPSGITRVVSPGPKRIVVNGSAQRPGNGMPLDRVHPGWRVVKIRPDDWKPQVGGLAYLPNGDLLVATFAPNQSGQFQPDLRDGVIWRVRGSEANDVTKIQREKVAEGLQEPLGIATIGDTAYVATRTAILQLVDANGDGTYESTKTVGGGWTTDNYHHFTFGLAALDGWLYGALSTSITFDAPGINGPNPRFRGSMFRVRPERYDAGQPLANIEFLTSGHRTPNGVSNGPNGLILVGENQGSWQPSNKLNVLVPGGFYGHVNATTFRNAAYPQGGVPGLFDDRPFTEPGIYLPQGEIANSPGQTVVIPKGEFAGQMLISDVKYGGLRRAWLEEVDGVWQGGVVQYSHGFEVGTNRLTWAPDGGLIIGGTGATETWAWADPKTGRWTQYGLQKLVPTGKTAFEIARVSATATGLRVTFNQPVNATQAVEAKRYEVQQWRYVPTVEYGGPKVDRVNLRPSLIQRRDDKTIDLTIPGMQPGHVVYLNVDVASAKRESLWASEVWYTLTRKPVAAALAGGVVETPLAKPRPRVLVMSKTAGFRHDSIETGVATIRAIAKERGWQVTATEDAGQFTDAGLANTDVVVFLNTTGDILNDAQQAAMERFVRAGGGFVGVHSATDTEYDWDWYRRLVGAQFKSHPQIQPADIRIEDRAHPTTDFLPGTWTRVDEWYDFRANPRPDVRVLANLDSKTYQGTSMEDHPIIWCHEFDGGRAWYTGGGHRKEAFDELLFRRHLAEGILWAAQARPPAGSVPIRPRENRTWTQTDGVWRNDRGTEPFLSTLEHGDAHVHVEFAVPKGGNSGVYLMGRYEVQILDSYGKPVRDLRHSDVGGIYERWKDDRGYEGNAPLTNAARPPEEWQTLDIAFVAPKFDANGRKIANGLFREVRLNGVVVQRNVPVTGPTRAALAEDERGKGPLMLQGDHGPIRYRNVTIRPY